MPEHKLKRSRAYDAKITTDGSKGDAALEDAVVASIWDMGISRSLNMAGIRNGNLSPLRKRGLVVGSRSQDIDLEFSAARSDSQFETTAPVPFSREASEEGVLRGGVSTSTGEVVTSTESGSGIIGTYWGSNRLSKDMSIINVVNGRTGTVGIKIPFKNLKEGNPVLVTSGALSGCTMVYAVDDANFYAFHTGQESNPDWSTGIQGPASMQKISDLLSGQKSRLMHGQHNNSLPDFLQNYRRSTITYFGKEGTRMDEIDSRNVRAFDYNQAVPGGRAVRTTYSYALITVKNGKPKVKVLSEDVTVNNKFEIKVVASTEERLV